MLIVVGMIEGCYQDMRFKQLEHEDSELNTAIQYLLVLGVRKEGWCEKSFLYFLFFWGEIYLHSKYHV